MAGLGVTASNMASGLATHLLRFSDVLLIYAEAKMGTARQTTDADAIEAFNRVRRRAGVDEDTDGTLTWEEVWKERRLELALEGDRWYDFVRRSYYDADGAIEEIRQQRRNEWYGLGTLYESYYDTGEWVVDEETVRYNSDTPAPNVTRSSFTLPIPAEDIVFNPHLAEPAVDVDVRALYSYDF